MRRSAGLRFLVVGLLVLLMFIPMFFVADVVDSRRSYSETTIGSVSREWGGAQTLIGPRLVVPVRETIDQVRVQQVVDPETGRPRLAADGTPLTENVTTRVTVDRAPVSIYPDNFEAEIDTVSEIRKRGIFTVPVYRASVEMLFDFPTDRAAALVDDGEVLQWNDSRIEVGLDNNAALRGTAELLADGQEMALEPLLSSENSAGVSALVGDPRSHVNYSLTLGLNGARSFQIAPVGRSSSISMASDWPHPSFRGAFLPDQSQVSDSGFSATWSIPHLARAVPQATRENLTGFIRQRTSFGVDYFQPNDFYQKAFRTSRYAVLFIALTFLTVLLIENRTERPVHPVQYILIGLAQSIFVLVMVAYAEQFGFGPAYVMSAGATILLLTIFGATALKLGLRSLVLGAMLIVLYAVLYLILQSADYALLAGSTLAFAALALTMYFTRNEDWYGPERPEGRGWFGRSAKAEEP